MGSSENDQQLQLLLGFICQSVNSKISINAKLLRDILDVVEGLMRGALNSKGNYDHSSLKINCAFRSEAVQLMRESFTGAELRRQTHREHAIPLKVLVKDLYRFEDLSVIDLRAFLNRNLISVLITKEEQRRLDSPEFGIRDQMPGNWNGENVFARFDSAGIRIVRSDVIRHAV